MARGLLISGWQEDVNMTPDQACKRMSWSLYVQRMAMEFKGSLRGSGAHGPDGKRVG